MSAVVLTMVLKILDVGKHLGILQAIKNPLTFMFSGFPVSVRMLSNSKLVELGGFEPPSEKPRPSVLHV
ncbi:hypothetical protein ATS76_18155 [Pseudoalteromonas sp. 10-33]|nr:hypothetical protein ATS76_18155 [Pseudoalteromonas sp. 10-33]